MTGPVKELDASEVMVGTANGAGLWIAPEGTKPPAKGAPFVAPWRSLGYASDDGPTMAGDTTTESLTPWQSRTPIRTIITERTQTVQFVMWQLNEDTLALYFNSDVGTATDDAFEFDVRSDSAGKIYAIGVDSLDGGAQFRIVYPRASLDSAGDLQLQKGAAVPLDVTLSALDDNGVLAHVFVKKGVASGAATLRVSAAPNAGDPAQVDVSAEPISTTKSAPAPEADDESSADVPAPDDAGVATGPSVDTDTAGTSTGDASGDTGASGTGSTGTATGGTP